MGYINPNAFKSRASLEKYRKRILIGLSIASIGILILCALLLPSEVGMQLTATSELGNYMPKALILPIFTVVIAAGEYMFYRNPCPPWLLLVLGVDLLAALSLVLNML